MSDFNQFSKEVTRVLRNAMNRTLTKVSKEQRELIAKRVSIKKRYLDKKRLVRRGARADDLSIKIFAMPKAITPFMLETHARPKGYDYGIPNGRHFYVRGITKHRRNKGNASGFKVGIISAKKRAKRGSKDLRPYYYLSKLSDLDTEALKISDAVLAKAEYIFSQELKK